MFLQTIALAGIGGQIEAKFARRRMAGDSITVQNRLHNGTGALHSYSLDPNCFRNLSLDAIKSNLTQREMPYVLEL